VWSFHDLDLVIAISFDSAGSGARGNRFLLYLESRGVAFLLVLVTSRDNGGDAVYLEGPNDLEKLL
jgi:hypothetical protein